MSRSNSRADEHACCHADHGSHKHSHSHSAADLEACHKHDHAHHHSSDEEEEGQHHHCHSSDDEDHHSHHSASGRTPILQAGAPASHHACAHDHDHHHGGGGGGSVLAPAAASGGHDHSNMNMWVACCAPAIRSGDALGWLGPSRQGLHQAASLSGPPSVSSLPLSSRIGMSLLLRAVPCRRRGAIIHVIGDFVQSIGVAVAGALIWLHQVRQRRRPAAWGAASTPPWRSAADPCSSPRPPAATTPLLCPPSPALACCPPPAAAAGRPSLVHRRPHLHLHVCRAGAVDHARHPARHWRRADGAGAARAVHQDHTR